MPDLASRSSRAERNLLLIPVHQGLASAFVWIPVMVLYTRSRFGLDGALLLSSIYYLSVVALEVPSGWMSDRLGRVVTMRVAALSWVLAQACLLLGDDRFSLIVAGEILLAGGFASLSGTDVTFHYDTLETLGRAAEYEARQARVAALGFSVTAASALVGGAVGLLALRAAFAVALGLAALQLLVTLALVEPAGDGDARGPSRARPVGDRLARLGQVGHCLGYLRSRYLGWIFLYGVVMVTLEHVAFAVLQPWLTALADRPADDVGATPLYSGLVFATVALVGAVAARASAPLARRFGTVNTLIGLAALSAVIVTAMAAWVAPLVLLLVAFRSAQGAAAPVLISGAVAPRVERGHRATLLSLNSLAGRLGWGLVLLVVSWRIGDDLELVLGAFSVLSWSLVVAVAVAAGVLLGRRPVSPSPSP
jgi:MFS family permease